MQTQRGYMKETKISPDDIFTTTKRPNSLVMLCIATCLLLASAITTAANSDKKKTRAVAPVATETCEVENFGKVNDHYYRGAQPEEGQYAQLKTLGVKTVIDLRDDPKGFAKAKAREAGLQYINLPLSDTKTPAEASVKKFLELANDDNNWPIFVHCAGGRHRTGALTAVYRMTMDNWNVERAYDEMKDYDFYTRWGHKAMKTFVFDYAKELVARKARSVAADGSVIAPTRDN